HLVGIPRKADARLPSDERRRAVAARQNSPRGRDDVEARPEDSDEGEDRERIEEDAEWKAARAIDVAVHRAAADEGEHDQVEEKGERRERGRLLPREEPQEQGERSGSDVDPLPPALRVDAHVRSRSASGPAVDAA